MAKEIGFGATFTVATTTGTLTIGQIRSISGPGSDADMVDTTTLDSSTSYRTFTQGLADPGEVSLEVVYDGVTAAVGHSRLETYQENRTSKVYTITYPTTANTQSFTAYVKGLSQEIPLDDLVMQTITMKITGDPGWSS